MELNLLDQQVLQHKSLVNLMDMLRLSYLQENKEKLEKNVEQPLESYQTLIRKIKNLVKLEGIDG